MKCSVFIATSVDGFIARTDGSVDWLHSAGNQKTDMGNQADMGFNDFVSSVDCMIMGRKCMEVISNMNLTPEQWPYGNIKIIVLSNTLTEAPSNMSDNVELYSGELQTLIARLESEGFNHAYIDGGNTIQGFLKLKLINEITITRAPLILGEGIPLFGKSAQDIKLCESKATAYPNDFVQVSYESIINKNVKKYFMIKFIQILIFFCSSLAFGQGVKYAGEYTFGTSPEKGPTGLASIYPESDSTLLVYLELSRGAPNYHSGALIGRLVINTKGNATYIQINKQNLINCRLDFAFNRKNLTISTKEGSDNCGFGYGVMADSQYKKKRNKKPVYFIDRVGEKTFFKNLKLE